VRVQTTFAGALTIIGREALRIVLPSWCVVCGENLPWRDRTASCCGSCWRSLPRITSVKCRSCALPLPSAEGDAICISCSADPLPLAWCEAWGAYRAGMERVLHAFKFERHDFLDDALAGLMCEALRDRDFDVVTAVPMHRTKERRRGYNQAGLLAAALGRRIGVRHEPLLRKPAEKQTQSTLARAARAANVRDVFVASPAASDKSILLVDDICTTGETLRACARELRRAGAARVCAITLAKAT
jgi:ComF family protein